jgi:hypothetical protein
MGADGVSRLEDQLHAIDAMDKTELGDRWEKLTGLPVPRVSVAILRLALAWELQANKRGGLPRSVQRQLEALDCEKRVAPVLRPGMRLAREHGGVMHVVTIGDQGEVCWNDRQWRSLSEVARAITGTRWSGPAFFGLRSLRRAA